MTTQTELPMCCRIPSRLSKRGVALSSLRPGDYIKSSGGVLFYVLQNSSKLRRIELKYKRSFVADYITVEIDGATYLGRGQPRRYWHFLPVFLQNRISPWRMPQ
jgi:hypothetical protein